jgi:hypothetical protein
MAEQIWVRLCELVKGTRAILYHIVVVALSAWVALSLPHATVVAAKTFTTHWPVIERNDWALVAVEIPVAVLLMACPNYLRRSVRDRKLAEAAMQAGLGNVFPTQRALAGEKLQN